MTPKAKRYFCLSFSYRSLALASAGDGRQKNSCEEYKEATPGGSPFHG